MISGWNLTSSRKGVNLVRILKTFANIFYEILVESRRIVSKFYWNDDHCDLYANVDSLLQRRHFETGNLCFPKQCRTKQADCIKKQKRKRARHMHFDARFCFYFFSRRTRKTCKLFLSCTVCVKSSPWHYQLKPDRHQNFNLNVTQVNKWSDQYKIYEITGVRAMI